MCSYKMTNIKVTNLLIDPSRDKIATPSKPTSKDVERSDTDEQEDTKQSIIINIMLLLCILLIVTLYTIVSTK